MASCRVPHDNALLRAERGLAVQAFSQEDQRHRAELQRVQAAIRDDRRALAVARDEAAATASTCREMVRRLVEERRHADAAEADLVAARARTQQRAEQLAQVLQLEGELRNRNTDLTGVRAQLAALDQQLADARAALAARQQAVAPQVAALQAQAAQLDGVQATVAAALVAVQQAAAALQPRPEQPGK